MAIEPNRWGTVSSDRAPTIRLADWLGAIADAGFDGIEVWERHLVDATDDDVSAIVDGPLRVDVFNSYCGFEAGDEDERLAAARWTARARARGVKFNVGGDPSQADGYSERLATWLDELPVDAVALCECHQRISIAEDPEVAARIFDRAGPADRLQAIVHTHDDADLLRAKFDAYGERITHVHVNFLDHDAFTHPRLESVADRLHDVVALLRELGFAGGFTLEFVAGILTERDEPAALIEQAAADLPVLRAAIA